MRYVEHPKVNAKKLIWTAEQLERELLALRGFKDVVLLISQPLPLVEVIKKVVNLMRAPILPLAPDAPKHGQRHFETAAAIAREF